MTVTSASLCFRSTEGGYFIDIYLAPVIISRMKYIVLCGDETAFQFDDWDEAETAYFFADNHTQLVDIAGLRFKDSETGNWHQLRQNEMDLMLEKIPVDI